MFIHTYLPTQQEKHPLHNFQRRDSIADKQGNRLGRGQDGENMK